MLNKIWWWIKYLTPQWVTEDVICQNTLEGWEPLLPVALFHWNCVNSVGFYPKANKRQLVGNYSYLRVFGWGFMMEMNKAPVMKEYNGKKGTFTEVLCTTSR